METPQFISFFSLGATEIILLVLVILLLFGGRKIPEMMKGIGQGLKEFKKAKDSDHEKQVEDDQKNSPSTDSKKKEADGRDF